MSSIKSALGRVMKRYFNTTGPCDARRHFMLPPTARLPSVQTLLDREQYFVLHAPRQTGKTTAMRALAEGLRAKGVAACWATLEASQGVDEIALAEPIWLTALHRAASRLPEAWHAPDPAPFIGGPAGTRLGAYLTAWARALEVPLVLLLDEADVVSGAAMVSLLRQLREGFMDRGVGSFPTSIALIGMRDLRDYLVLSKDGRQVNPGSPFNVKAASLTLRNFNADEVGVLLSQHTAETGQPFLPEAVTELARLTDGQPYLVNALADLCVTDLVPDRTEPVTREHIDTARERLILARTTHLDSLAERLKEPRVARIVQATLLGDDPRAIPYDSDDFAYVLDLGLLRRGADGAEAANPLYREILVRQLSSNLQSSLARPWWPWATPDGRLDFPALLEAFQAWWRENADALGKEPTAYPEAIPHLALCAFLQRVVNGGGRVHREFAASRGAMDLLVEYGPDRFAVELKRVRDHDALETIVSSGVEQLGRYLDSLGLEHGWLVVFDVRGGRTWESRLWQRKVTLDHRSITVLGA
jgi:hypothetical protein